MPLTMPLAGNGVDKSDAITDTSKYPNISIRSTTSPAKDDTNEPEIEEKFLKTLSTRIYDDQETARYCCGGRIPIFKRSQSKRADSTAPRITIRFENPKCPQVARKLTLPWVGKDLNNDGLHRLLDACDSGTLGATRFSTNFHPHDYGILNSISQALARSSKKFMEEGRAPHTNTETIISDALYIGIKAELSHLQITSRDAPSRPVECMPNTEKYLYVGILVVCLPHRHDGGQLRVSHKSHSTMIDWNMDMADANHIEWAAFDTHCNYELLPVRSGYRISLVYHILAPQKLSKSLKQQTQTNTDPTRFPIYANVTAVLQKPGFFRQGGVLGFYCQHGYEHTKPRASELLPSTLKGVDLMIYSVFRALGCELFVRPIVDQGQSTKYWANTSDESLKSSKDPPMIGSGLHKLILYDTRDTEDLTSLEQAERQFRLSWPYHYWDSVKWTNSRKPELLELAAMATHWNKKGDSCKHLCYYSSLAILVKIPRWEDRKIESSRVNSRLRPVVEHLFEQRTTRADASSSS